jgi:hypothetical protein
LKSGVVVPENQFAAPLSGEAFHNSEAVSLLWLRAEPRPAGMIEMLLVVRCSFLEKNLFV